MFVVGFILSEADLNGSARSHDGVSSRKHLSAVRKLTK